MLFAFPLPDQFFVSRNFDHIRVALEFMSQGRAHGFVECVDEQIAVVAHLIVVVGAAAHAPDECAAGIVFKNADVAALRDARAVMGGHQEMAVGQQSAVGLDGVLREVPGVGWFSVHVDEVHHGFFADFPVWFREGFLKKGCSLHKLCRVCAV